MSMARLPPAKCVIRNSGQATDWTACRSKHPAAACNSSFLHEQTECQRLQPRSFFRDGTALDTELAARFGRTVNVVRVMPWRMGKWTSQRGAAQLRGPRRAQDAPPLG
jgi:hypothetical protein